MNKQKVTKIKIVKNRQVQDKYLQGWKEEINGTMMKRERNGEKKWKIKEEAKYERKIR